MQNQLAELNRRFTAIFESISDPFFLVDGGMVIQYCNPAAENAFDKRRGELLGRVFFEVFPVLQGGVFEEWLIRAARNKAASFFDARIEQGPVANWYSVNVYPYDEGVSICLRDITQSKIVENALRENEALLNLILDASPAATALTVNRVVEWVNEGWVKMFGFGDKTEPLGLDSRTLYPNEKESEGVGRLYQELPHCQVAHTEAVMKRKDGSLFEAAVYLRAVDPEDLSKGVISAILDITEKKEAQRQVEVAQRKLERALNGAELGWWCLEIPTQRVDRNERYAEMLGYSPEEIELTRSGWETLVHPEDLGRTLRVLDDHLKSKAPFFESEYRMRTKDGRWKWVLDRGKIIERDAEDRPLLVAGTILDISYRKELEQDHIEMQRKVLQAQKLESLSLMAGGIAHQFNNLLQIVLGNLELLEMNMPRNSRAGSFVDSAFKAARRAAKLSGLMLDYTGQSLYISKDVDANEIVVKGKKLFSSLVPKNVEFVVNLGDVRHAVLGNAAQIEQVIMSLVTNAAEAADDGPGEIRLATGEMDCDEAYLATTRQELHPAPRRYVFVEVSDTGRGMDTAALERIFDPFFTTKFMGRGLGMASVLGIVRGHRGGIRIDSTPGKGTTVRVLLPAGPALGESRESLERTREQEISTAVSSESSGKVLIVDDDEAVLQVGADLLASLGYESLKAIKGEEAIEVCTEQGNSVRCVIVDLSMPKMDGLLTLRELNHRRPDLSIIVSSGFPEPEARLIVGDVDVAGFLTKPYDLDTFKAVLEKAQKDSPE